MSLNFVHAILCCGQEIYSLFFSLKVKKKKKETRDLLRIVWVGLRDK